MSRLEIFKDHRRPCFIRGRKGELTKAFFHCFVSESEPIAPSIRVGGHPGGLLQLTYAIVEAEDGQVHKLCPTSIIFNDGGGFEDYDWSNEVKGKKTETDTIIDVRLHEKEKEND